MVPVASRGPQDQERREARGEGVISRDARAHRNRIAAAQRRQERDVPSDVERRYYCVERGGIQRVIGPRGESVVIAASAAMANRPSLA